VDFHIGFHDPGDQQGGRQLEEEAGRGRWRSGHVAPVCHQGDAVRNRAAVADEDAQASELRAARHDEVRQEARADVLQDVVEVRRPRGEVARGKGSPW
jgi:hypothetical protein